MVMTIKRVFHNIGKVNLSLTPCQMGVDNPKLGETIKLWKYTSEVC